MSVNFLLDMSKAFDSIRYDLMLRKIRKAGVSESACAWFEAIYRNVIKSLNLRVLYLLPYRLLLGYRKDPSWARCCLHCM